MSESRNTIIVIVVTIAILAGAFILLYRYQGGSDSDQINNEIAMSDDQGLAVETLVEGEGDKTTAPGDKIYVHYTGTLEDGTEFDSSVGSDPFSFTLGQGEVIPGWDQGLAGMKVGEKRKLTIPASLGYGETGAGEAIPPNSTLIFETELISIGE